MSVTIKRLIEPVLMNKKLGELSKRNVAIRINFYSLSAKLFSRFNILLPLKVKDS